MSLTPLDIHNKQFSRSFRGYNETEVDEFLEQVAREFDQVVRDNAALREQVESLTAKLEQYRQLEDTLHNTLVVAQETAEEVKASAQKQAELMVNQARLEASQIVQEARGRVEQLERRYNDLLSTIQAARARLRSMLMAHLQLLEETAGQVAEEDGAKGPAVSPGEDEAAPGAAAGRDRVPAVGAEAGPAAATTGSSLFSPGSSGGLAGATGAGERWASEREAAATREGGRAPGAPSGEQAPARP